MLLAPISSIRIRLTRKRRAASVGDVLRCLLSLVVILHAPAIAGEVSFRRDIAPVLLANCHACHNQRTAEGSFRLDTFAQLRRPGDSGEQPVVAGNPEQSELFRRLVTESQDERMPLEAEPLPDSIIATMRQWIRAGAPYDAEDHEARLASILPVTRHPDPPAKYKFPLPITALAFDGKELLVGGYHELLRWEWRSPKMTARIPQVGERSYALHVDAATRRLFVGSGTPGQLGEVRVLDVDTKELLGVPVTIPDSVLDIEIQPGGEWLAAAGADARIHLVNLRQLRRVQSWDSHSDWVHAVAWNAAGTMLASASRDRTAKLFDFPSGRVRATYSQHGASVVDIDFLTDASDRLVSCDRKGQFHIWNASEADKKGGNPTSQAARGIRVLATARGVWLVSDAEAIQQVKGENVVRKLRGFSHPLLSVAIDEDLRWLAAGDAAGQVWIWDIQQEKLLQQFSALPLQDDDTGQRR